MYRFTVLLSLGFASILLAGCASETATDEPDPNADQEEIVRKGTPAWVYDGLLPSLEEPRVLVSLDGHTARVNGLLPASFDGPLPFYAKVDAVDGGRRKVTVVYPIASGATSRLDTPGTFKGIEARPFRPDGMTYPRSTAPSFVTWGGFPFLAYNGGIAFHGPITYRRDDGGGDFIEWYLQRGDVSHGCNRMQGEHVVELAQLVGIDMRTAWKAGEFTSVKNVTITVQRDYDRIGTDVVDVDYPTVRGAEMPATPLKFKTWNGDDFPRWVCADRRTVRPRNVRLPADFCNKEAPNKRDAITGQKI